MPEAPSRWRRRAIRGHTCVLATVPFRYEKAEEIKNDGENKRVRCFDESSAKRAEECGVATALKTCMAAVGARRAASS
jgi:hypothetical protein